MITPELAVYIERAILHEVCKDIVARIPPDSGPPCIDSIQRSADRAVQIWAACATQYDIRHMNLEMEARRK